MKKISSALALSLCFALLFVSCGNKDNPGAADSTVTGGVIMAAEADYAAVIKNVCAANGLDYIDEAETFAPGMYEIILCGKIENYMGTVVIVPDDGCFAGYTWPWGGDGKTFLGAKDLYDRNGDKFEFADISELYGRHVVLICMNTVAASYPGQLVNQRVTVIVD